MPYMFYISYMPYISSPINFHTVRSRKLFKFEGVVDNLILKLKLTAIKQLQFINFIGTFPYSIALT